VASLAVFNLLLFYPRDNITKSQHLVATTPVSSSSYSTVSSIQSAGSENKSQVSPSSSTSIRDISASGATVVTVEQSGSTFSTESSTNSSRSSSAYASSTMSTEPALNASSYVGNETLFARVTSVSVTKIGFSNITNSTIFRSNISLSYETSNNTFVGNYTFPVVPWNFTLLKGLWVQVQFVNGNVSSLIAWNGSFQNYTHTHILLNLKINGLTINVPQGMGITNAVEDSVGFITDGIFDPIHTHDSSNTIHFEIDVSKYNFTLSDIFDEWGYVFNSSCAWDKCGGRTQVYLGGSESPYNQGPLSEIAIPFDSTANAPYNVTIVWSPSPLSNITGSEISWALDRVSLFRSTFSLDLSAFYLCHSHLSFERFRSISS